MPRGGKRPGTGARKGNFNALRSGNHSVRLVAVYFAMLEHPDKRALAAWLFDDGVLRRDRPFDRRRDLPAAIDLL